MGKTFPLTSCYNEHMINSCLGLVLITLLLLIPSGIAHSEEILKPVATKTEYIIIDPAAFNKSVISAWGESWTSDPVTVSLKFTGPFEGLTQSIERMNDSAESPETTTVTITSEGLLDDSVMGEKFLLKLKRTGHGAWLIESAGKKVKCWPGRGHQDYSNKPCN